MTVPLLWACDMGGKWHENWHQRFPGWFIKGCDSGRIGMHQSLQDVLLFLETPQCCETAGRNISSIQCFIDFRLSYRLTTRKEIKIEINNDNNRMSSSYQRNGAESADYQTVFWREQRQWAAPNFGVVPAIDLTLKSWVAAGRYQHARRKKY